MPQFREDFADLVGDSNYVDGHVFGNWNVVFAGYGGVDVSDAYSGEPAMHLAPAISRSSSATHGSMAVGPTVPAEFIYRCKVRTLEQLRENDPPNNWEVAWVIWNYKQFDDFYAFHALALKPTGWEFNRKSLECPAESDHQCFISGDDSTKFPIGTEYLVEIRQSNDHVEIIIDGVSVYRHSLELPNEARQIGIYSEDASILYGDVLVEFD